MPTYGMDLMIELWNESHDLINGHLRGGTKLPLSHESVCASISKANLVKNVPYISVCRTEKPPHQIVRYGSKESTEY
jgi:hypothetical protein